MTDNYPGKQYKEHWDVYFPVQAAREARQVEPDLLHWHILHLVLLWRDRMM